MVCTCSCSAQVAVAEGTTSPCLARTQTWVLRHTADQEEVAPEEAGMSRQEEARARLRQEERLHSGLAREDPEDRLAHIGHRLGAHLESEATSHVLMVEADIGYAVVDGLPLLRQEVAGRQIPLVGGRPCSHSGLTWFGSRRELVASSDLNLEMCYCANDFGRSR